MFQYSGYEEWTSPTLHSVAANRLLPTIWIWFLSLQLPLVVRPGNCSCPALALSPQFSFFSSQFWSHHQFSPPVPTITIPFQAASRHPKTLRTTNHRRIPRWHLVFIFWDCHTLVMLIIWHHKCSISAFGRKLEQLWYVPRFSLWVGTFPWECESQVLIRFVPGCSFTVSSTYHHPMGTFKFKDSGCPSSAFPCSVLCKPPLAWRSFDRLFWKTITLLPSDVMTGHRHSQEQRLLSQLIRFTFFNPGWYFCK